MTGDPATLREEQTVLEVLDEIVAHGRAIISPELAERWAKEFRGEGGPLTLADIGLAPRRMDSFHRATYTDPELQGVATYEVAIAIANAIVGNDKADPYATIFHGTGRNAALWTRRAVNRIRVHYGYAPIDEYDG